MNLFNKTGSGLAASIHIDIFNEPSTYTTSDKVRGQVLLAVKNWEQAMVEVLLICEEQAELNPEDVEVPQYRYRRMTIAGETLDGEGIEDDYGGMIGSFPFELRILEDPHKPHLLPSFAVESGVLQLSNAVKWSLEARVTHKGKEARDSHEITVIPSRAAMLSEALRLERANIEMRAYEPRTDKKALIRRSQPFQTASVSAVLALPQGELGQAPDPLALKLMLLTSHPELLVVSRISLQLITIASATIGGETSAYTIFENLATSDKLQIRPSAEQHDLTQYVSSVNIENTCSSFAGKWLKMRHRLQVQITLESAEKRDYKQTISLQTAVSVRPPVSTAVMEGLIDAPPQYTPTTTLPITASTLLGDSPPSSPTSLTTSQTLSLMNQLNAFQAASATGS